MTAHIREWLCCLHATSGTSRGAHALSKTGIPALPARCRGVRPMPDAAFTLLRGSSEAGRFRRRSAGPVAVTYETTALMTNSRVVIGSRRTARRSRCRPTVDGHEHGSSILPRGDQIPCNH
jgi:hypothetical protein